MSDALVLRAAVRKPMAPLASIPAAPPRSGWLWIDLVEPSRDELEAAARALGIDAALVESLRHDAYPSARTTTGALVLVTRSLTAEETRVGTTPLILVLSRKGILSIRFQELPGLTFVAEQAVLEAGPSAGGPDVLLARLVEVGTQRFVPLTDELDDAIEGLEQRAVDAHPDVLPESFALRRDASLLRGVLRSQRDVLRALLRGGSPLLGEEAHRHLEDAYDMHQRVVESLETARTMLSGVIEVYRSAVAERTNDAMKVLTVFAAIMLPLSLIAGIYGMNFARIPELQHRWGYFVVLGVMAAIAIGLWLYFVRRGFIGGPKRARAVGRGLVHVAFLPIKTVSVVTRTIADVVTPGERGTRDEP